MTSARQVARHLWHRIPWSRRQAVQETALARFAYRNVWARPGHFYSPYADIHEVRAREHEIFDASRALAAIDVRHDEQMARLESLVARHGVPEVPEHPDGTSRYHLANVPFGYGDGLLAALLLGDIRPKRYVEVGSGWSSMLVLDLADRRFGEAFAPVFIDPFPDDRIRSEPRAQLLEVPVQAVPLSRFEELEAGDVLFVDSTHVAKPGSDVNWLLFEVLPRLARGVVVHFHDIHHPFEYPKGWVYQGRAWNETYLLHAFLMFNGSFEILLWGSYLMAREAGWFETHLPLALRNPGGSLWLRRC